MTWQEYFDDLVEHGCDPEIAQNRIGHLMDLYEIWGWDEQIPDAIKR